MQSMALFICLIALQFCQIGSDKNTFLYLWLDGKSFSFLACFNADERVSGPLQMTISGRVRIGNFLPIRNTLVVSAVGTCREFCTKILSSVSISSSMVAALSWMPYITELLFFLACISSATVFAKADMLDTDMVCVWLLGVHSPVLFSSALRRWSKLLFVYFHSLIGYSVQSAL